MTKAILTTSVEAKSDQVQKVLAALKKKYNDVELITKVDKNVIGGMSLQINSRLIDMTLKTKLQQLQKKLLQI